MRNLGSVYGPKAARWLGCVMMVAALSLGGCASTRSPLPQRLDAGGVPHSFKRAEQYPQRDYYHHCVRKAYRKTNYMFEPVGRDQELTVTQWGQPDWIRKPFRSLENEKVTEWLYLKENHLFQFIGTELVYDGPLTEYEQTLLARGFPDRTHMVLRENGEREDLFVYTRLFTPWLEQFKFRDGRLIESQEGY